MNVKVYNIGELIENQLPDKKVFWTNKYAIVQGSNGVVMFDNEAIGWKRDSLDDKVEIGLTDIPEENTIFAMAQYNVKVSIKELLEAEYEEMSITQFVERYETKSRIRSNFDQVLSAIAEVR